MRITDENNRRWSLAVALTLFVAIVGHSAEFDEGYFDYKGFTHPYRDAVFNGGGPDAKLVVLLYSRHGCGIYNDAHKRADGVDEV